jgi:predicted small metal-binding protein
MAGEGAMSISIQCPMCGMDIVSEGSVEELLSSLSQHRQQAHNMPAMKQEDMDRMRLKIKGLPQQAKKPWWRRLSG